MHTNVGCAVHVYVNNILESIQAMTIRRLTADLPT